MMTDTTRLTFPKSERLRHRSLVEKLFSEGESIYDFPLRMVWRTLDDRQLSENFRDHIPDGIAPLQMMVTVPKKRRRHAVDRVRMRRLIREAWRLNRRSLRMQIEERTGYRTVSVAILYIANQNLPMAKISTKINRLISQLSARIETAVPITDTTDTAEESDVK